MALHAKGQAEHGVPSRGMTTQEAAELFGISVPAFYNKQRKGEVPRPTLPCGRYDRVLLERAMDRLSGIDREPPPLSPLDQWRSRRGSGQT
jgi:hypothetical protein